MRQGFQSLAGFGRMKQPCPTGGKKEGETKKEEGKNFSFSP
jgi:hypothetical protein